MADIPTPVDLLDAVLVFLRDSALPQLDSAAQFEARVACSLLQTVRRELKPPDGGDPGELARLQALLRDERDNVVMLNCTLCERIAHGDIDLNNEALLTHLWAVTVAKLAIDQPNYSTYRLATQYAIQPVSELSAHE
jgi:hypothetical protein